MCVANPQIGSLSNEGESDRVASTTLSMSEPIHFFAQNKSRVITGQCR